MVSAANQRSSEAAGLSFILGARIPRHPYVVAQWREEHSDEIPDGHPLTQPWPAGLTDARRDLIYDQYRTDRARRTLAPWHIVGPGPGDSPSGPAMA
jgi:hypothetical protein